MRLPHLFFVAVLLLGFPCTGWAQSDPYTLPAYALQEHEAVLLDGRLDEPFWQTATAISDFTQQAPREGDAPSERTEVRVAFSRDALYIGAFLFDSEPNGIIGHQKRRDQGLGADDRFMWILSTFNDGRNAYFFEVNPAGLMGDALLTIGQGTVINKAWNGIWDARVRKQAEGWAVEVRIPFRTLDFDPDLSTWGINFQRTVRRKNEEIVWAGWRRNQGLFRPQNAGVLTGLSGLSQGIGVEMKPYINLKPAQQWPEGRPRTTQYGRTAGLDLTYSITPRLRASITYNTDFAEAEVDQRRVNLTRFPIAFPEQRDFFLEGASVFSFASASNVNPFFSRRIGLQGGEPVPIQAGARVIGRVGKANLGLYQIRTESAAIPQEDFTVARVTHDVFSESRVGVIYTRRATLNQDVVPDRHTVGVDFELGTSRFRGTKNLQAQVFFVTHTANTLGEGTDAFDRSARGFRVAFPNFPFYWHLSYREFGKAYDPAVGFAQRVAMRRVNPNIEYTWLTPRSRWVRSVTMEYTYEAITDLDFRLESESHRWEPFSIEFESGDDLYFAVERNFERLDRPFDIRRDGTVLIPAGRYVKPSGTVGFWSASFRKVAFQTFLTYETFWTGTRLQSEMGLTLRPVSGVNLTGEWNIENIDLAEGAFTTHLVRVRGNIDPTPFLAFTSIVQYDNLSGLLGTFQRLRWILQPGADLYLVYSHNWRESNDRFHPIERSGALKVSYTVRI